VYKRVRREKESDKVEMEGGKNKKREVEKLRQRKEMQSVHGK
jgi:hypothetical protein